MGRLLLIGRLAVRDLRHRAATAVLLLLAITAAATTLTLGRTVAAMIEGRDETSAAIDQPELIQGNWVRPGEIVLERAFADALGAAVGQRVTLNGRSFLIGGIAVTAGIPPYPTVCAFGCDIGPQLPDSLPGLMWATQAITTGLATSSEPLNYLLNLRLKDATTADAFATTYNNSHPAPNAPYLMSWQTISADDARLVLNEQRVLMVGGWLLGLLALASVAVLVGGRMTEQTRRVGLVVAVALGVAILATLIPVVRAARPSTVAALTTTASFNPSARPPRRTPGVVWLSARTVLEARYISALTRALGATPDQVGAGISAAQTLPALAGALLGVPGGIGLYAAVKNDNGISYPPAWWFVATVLGTVVAVIAITGVPAWFGAHRPAAEILQSELA